MNDRSDQKPTAFVIMPFDDQFDAVYEQFIKTILEDLGFQVSRADTHLHMENVMRSIVRGINDSSLIIADLSIPNENVYYELGLAHALDRPVVLLTERVDDLPFDLRSYRVIEYSTHFARFPVAMEALKQVAAGFLDGSITFGSPIADFLNRPVTQLVSRTRFSRPNKIQRKQFLNLKLMVMSQGFSITSSISRTDLATLEVPWKA